jgi:hypothetical protein
MLGRFAQIGLRMAAWSVLAAFVLFTAYVSWLVIIALVLLGEGPSSSDILPVLVSVLVAVTLILAVLVALFISSPGRVAAAVTVMVIIVLGIEATWAWANPDWALYQARAAGWGESDVNDYQKFPQRLVANGNSVYSFPVASTPSTVGHIEYQSGGQTKTA